MTSEPRKRRAYSKAPAGKYAKRRGQCAIRTPVRAGKPRGPTLVSIFMHALIVARASRIRDKNRRPCTDIPDQFAEAAGFAHVRPAQVAGSLASGRGLPKREPRNSPKGSRDRLPQFYQWPPTSASRACRRYKKSPHGTRSGSVGILPLSYLGAPTPASPHGCAPARRSVKTTARERSGPRARF